MDKLTAVGGLLLGAISLAGWGAMLGRRCVTSQVRLIPRVGIGLSMVLAIGGLLNLAHLVSTITLSAVIAIGALSFAWHYRTQLRVVYSGTRQRTRQNLAAQVDILLASTIIVALASFAIATQLPPAAVNYHDDLQKYFAHPVRQLGTGTLRASPLSALGSETLGGMAYLHSFVAAFWPIAYINGIDAILGFVLLMALVAWAATAFGAVPGAVTVSVLLTALIVPQYVNVSALYVSSALMATATVVCVRHLSDGRGRTSPALLGLIYGGLVALKSTNALFPLAHFPAVLAAVWITGGFYQSAKWGLDVVLWSAVAIAPWALLHLPHYLNGIGADSTAIPGLADEVRSILSTQPLFYGGTAATYTAVVAIAVATSAVMPLLLLGKRPTEDDNRAALAANVLLFGSAVACATICAALILLAPKLAGFDTGIRYSVPFVLGVAPIVIAMSIGELTRASHIIPAAIAVGLVMLIGLSFASSRAKSWEQAAKHGSILAFSKLATDLKYLDYMRDALSAGQRERVRALQAKVSPGEPVAAWINQPFFLDYARNPILDIEPAGLARSWAKLPARVRYVIWEVNGPGVRGPEDYERGTRTPGANERLINVKTLSFIKLLEAKVRRGTVLHFDGNFLVSRFSENE